MYVRNYIHIYIFTSFDQLNSVKKSKKLEKRQIKSRKSNTKPKLQITTMLVWWTRYRWHMFILAHSHLRPSAVLVCGLWKMVGAWWQLKHLIHWPVMYPLISVCACWLPSNIFRLPVTNRRFSNTLTTLLRAEISLSLRDEISWIPEEAIQRQF